MDYLTWLTYLGLGRLLRASLCITDFPFKHKKHRTAFLAYSALEDPDNSLTRVLKLGKQRNTLYLYFISILQRAVRSLEEKRPNGK
jgi:hypothetical protein